MPSRKRLKLLAHFKKSRDRHRKTTLYGQVAAYIIILLLWGVPIPNPIKMLVVTLHELSHALAAVATGGEVYGLAINANAAGVTMGSGGIMWVILIAGHVGSSMCGALLYYGSVRWRPETCMAILTALILISQFFGWLNNIIILVGTFTILLVSFLMSKDEWIKVGFVRLVGAACCLYAPMDVLGEVYGSRGGMSFEGDAPRSDIGQFADLLSINPFIVGAIVLIAQTLLLIFLIRWTCKEAPKAAVKEEIQTYKKRRQHYYEIHPEKRVYHIRKGKRAR